MGSPPLAVIGVRADSVIEALNLVTMSRPAPLYRSTSRSPSPSKSANRCSQPSGHAPLPESYLLANPVSALFMFVTTTRPFGVVAEDVGSSVGVEIDPIVVRPGLCRVAGDGTAGIVLDGVEVRGTDRCRSCTGRRGRARSAGGPRSPSSTRCCPRSRSPCRPQPSRMVGGRERWLADGRCSGPSRTRPGYLTVLPPSALKPAVSTWPSLVATTGVPSAADVVAEVVAGNEVAGGVGCVAAPGARITRVDVVADVVGAAHRKEADLGGAADGHLRVLGALVGLGVASAAGTQENGETGRRAATGPTSSRAGHESGLRGETRSSARTRAKMASREMVGGGDHRGSAQHRKPMSSLEVDSPRADADMQSYASCG